MLRARFAAAGCPLVRRVAITAARRLDVAAGWRGGRAAFASHEGRSKSGGAEAAGVSPFVAAAAVGGCLLALLAAVQAWPRNRVAGPRPTDVETVEAVLELLQEGVPSLTSAAAAAGGAEGPLFVDLGSGDGRVVDAVVRRFGCRAVGVEVMEESVAASAALAAKLPAELAGRSRFLCADMGEVDLSQADVLFIYLPQTVARGVVLNLLPLSGLRVGTQVLIEDAPKDFRTGAPAFGMKHLRAGGVTPPSRSRPALDLFEWRGSVFVDKRQAKQVEVSRQAGKPSLPLWESAH